MIDSKEKVTAVIGASDNPERYSYKAVHALLKSGYGVIPLGIKKGSVAGLQIVNDQIPINNVHTVTLYVNPKNQELWEDYILALRPSRIIFNPGTENPEFANRAEKLGIETHNACTLVLLATNQY